MAYLQPTEYAQYGLSTDTSDDWIVTASSLIDAYCRRTSLLTTQYVERMRLTEGSQAVRLSYLPLIAEAPATTPITGVRVRYARPRRGETPDLFREQIAWAFGLPGNWSSLDPTTLDLNPATGDLTFPANFLGIDYNEAEIAYTSGFDVVPVPVKVACAQIVKNAQATPAANVKTSRMDTLQMDYFSGSLIDPQVQSLLRPYIAQRIG